MYRLEEFPRLPDALPSLREGLMSPDSFDQLALSTNQFNPEYLSERQAIFEGVKHKALGRLTQLIYSKKDTLDSGVYDYLLSRLAAMSDRLFVDMKAPEGAGGYYNSEKQFLAVPPLIYLYADPDVLDRAIQHEFIHAILLTTDETLTDGLAVQLIGFDVEGIGYVDQVEIYNQYFGHLDAGDALSLLNPDPQVAIANLIMEMINRHWQKPQDVNELREIVRMHWDTLKHILPRLIAQAVGESQADYETTDIAFDRFWNQNQTALKFRYWGDPEREVEFSES